MHFEASEFKIAVEPEQAEHCLYVFGLVPLVVET
jgi:hypothetical protein